MPPLDKVEEVDFTVTDSQFECELIDKATYDRLMKKVWYSAN